jgi:hypothetical protein
MTKNKSNLIKSLASISAIAAVATPVIALTNTSCATDEDDDPTYVIFQNASTNGDSHNKTTIVILKFNKPIDLDMSNINISSEAVVIVTSFNKAPDLLTYTLGVDVSQQNAGAKVTVSKEGYTIGSPMREIMLYCIPVIDFLSATQNGTDSAGTTTITLIFG